MRYLINIQFIDGLYSTFDAWDIEQCKRTQKAFRKGIICEIKHSKGFYEVDFSKVIFINFEEKDQRGKIKKVK